MASSMIHIAVANEINKKLSRNISKLLIGTIAPDISKLIGETRHNSHFLTGVDNSIPNIDEFLNKYKKYLDDDFVMGYYIHLYTDYLWFKYFIDNAEYSSSIMTIDGTRILCDKDSFNKYVYNDYTNMNITLIDKYNLDLKIFYNDIPDIKHIIEEIPMDKLDVIVNKAGEIVANSRLGKVYLFDITNVEKFVNLAIELIFSEIEKLDKTL